LELVRRRTNLSWSHHREVAPLEPGEQDYWLDIAETEGLSRKELRNRIKQNGRDPVPALSSAIKSPRLIVGHAEDMVMIEGESIDLIITSPPYNMGQDQWPMGGNGRVPRENGIGYSDDLSESEYQDWQVQCLIEMYRVAKQGASLFYNHKVRNRGGCMIHPLDWLRDEHNPWTLRQEIVWDRGSTHNHSPSLFWPEDERIYWMTKGKPTLPNRPIGESTVWRFHGPVAGTFHPAPFDEELPRKCIEAVGRDGIMVLDPFAGGCTTLKVALDYGYDAVGVDICAEYLEDARKLYGWTRKSET
jgi:DNA modification methylase